MIFILGLSLSTTPTTIEEKLKQHFTKVMQRDDVPLLNDFRTYCESLPVRNAGARTTLQLYKLPFLIKQKALDEMAQNIQTSYLNTRATIRYISAPSASGKTASVLPAFLKSAEKEDGGNIYLYLAFSNNNENHFTCLNDPDIKKKVAETQGAAFIAQCVQALLEHPNNASKYEISLSQNLPIIKDIREGLQQYLYTKLGKDVRIWFHLDEHRKMCDRTMASGADFSLGAMQTLASIRGARVIATYTNLPNEIPAATSSSVCRHGVPLPPLDIDQLMERVSELRINTTTSRLEKEEKRLLATLKVRLGLLMRTRENFSLVSILHKPELRKPEEQEFLSQFQTILADHNMKDGLKKCNELCAKEIKFAQSKIPLDDATKLLIGLEDKDNLFASKQIDNIVALPDGQISLSLETLVSVNDPKINVYSKGLKLFKHSLKRPDLISSTPLEAAYYWKLSCESAIFEGLTFGDNNFDIK